MDVSIAEAKNRLPELIRAVEDGEKVVITRHGKPVAQISAPPPERRQVRLGGMKDRIELLPGWDTPIDLDRFL
jgi:antitoxin (DNA-binding transcriptional repressor) of toxin-antitoxin stability system